MPLTHLPSLIKFGAVLFCVATVFLLWAGGFFTCCTNGSDFDILERQCRELSKMFSSSIGDLTFMCRSTQLSNDNSSLSLP